MSRHTVLVTDGEQRSSLAVVRSLGAQGHRVMVTSNRRRSLAGASRYARRASVVPSALREPGAFVDAIADLCSTENVDVVIPTTDASLLALLPQRQRLLPAILPVGSESAYRAASDKALLQRVAPRFGIAVPRHVTLLSAEALGAVDLAFPVVVKPSRSVSEHATGMARHWTARYANSSAELESIVRDTASDSYPLLIQERIVGPGIGVFLLLWHGRQIASFSHRRVREKPPSGGVSVYAESVQADPALVDRSRELLTSLGFEGVAMVEYKVSAATGVPYLMEINGRFWGSLQLAIDAGVDFPALLLAVALDGCAPPAPTPILGVRTRWWWGEVDHLLARLRHSPVELALPSDAPTRWRAILDFLRPGARGVRNQVLRADDPRPALQETIDWIRGR